MFHVLPAGWFIVLNVIYQDILPKEDRMISRISFICVVLLLLQAVAFAEEYVVVPVENPECRPNKLFGPPEDLTSPRFKGIREKYALDDVVKEETDEFKRILLLRHWLRTHVITDKSKPAVEGDALRMLEEAPKGGRYHCGHFDKMQSFRLYRG